MVKEDIKTIKTTKGELRYYQDWDNWDGGIRMLNAQTIKRYREIRDTHPDADKYGVFFAFSRKQFAEGYKRLVELGHIKDGDKVVQDKATGAFGTKEGLDGFFKFYDDNLAAIPKECDPQEVYFYEYNNHESMIAWDGDLEAIKLIISYWGADIARTIKRFNASMSVDNIIRKPISIEGLYFISEDQRHTPTSIWFSGFDNELVKTGSCYCGYGNGLHPVLQPNGEPYNNMELKGISAHYNGKKIFGFYKE